MIYAVNEAGVAAMRAVAASVEDAVEVINSKTSEVQSTADEYENTLGPHKASLDEALEEIANVLKDASAGAVEVAERLNDVADGYQEIIDDDKIGSGK